MGKLQMNYVNHFPFDEIYNTLRNELQRGFCFLIQTNLHFQFNRQLVAI